MYEWMMNEKGHTYFLKKLARSYSTAGLLLGIIWVMMFF